MAGQDRYTVTLRYQSGDGVHLDDIVDLGSGAHMRVVVIVPSGASEGFDMEDWRQYGAGILLQDQRIFGLLWLGADDLDHECVLARRADLRSS
jgi:hypothetical protein